MAGWLLFLGSVAAVSDAGPFITLSPLPPPAPGDIGRRGFEIRAPWLEGSLEMRFPETLASSMGLHFIDHERADMPPLSRLDPFPQWQRDDLTGALRYDETTPEGLAFSGSATPREDAVDLEFRVRNGTGKALDRVNCQMCLVLSRAPAFAKRHDLRNTFAWVDETFTSLAKTTPTPEEKGRLPWILVLTRERAANFHGAREWPDGWWVVDQMADRSLIARVAEDGRHLVAIAWDETASQLMTNTSIPCLHAGPIRGLALAPGEKGRWRGTVYLMPNDTDALAARHDQDCARWRE